MALSGRTMPSVITLRLAFSRIGYVNQLLEKALPAIEQDVRAGSLITVEDHGLRSFAASWLVHQPGVADHVEAPDTGHARAICAEKMLGMAEPEVEASDFFWDKRALLGQIGDAVSLQRDQRHPSGTRKLNLKSPSARPSCPRNRGLSPITPCSEPLSA
jgi:hypothetical protein